MNRNLILAVVALAVASAVNVSEAEVLPTVSDVRVAPMLESHWRQKEFGGSPAFNLYTPNNYPIGCVAASFIQIMRYWQMPVTSVSPATRGCWVDGTAGKYTMFGGTYDWDLMPLTSDDCTSDEQREALGHLAYDFCVASHTSWGKMSGTFSDLAATSLTKDFGYASARTFTFDTAKYVQVNIRNSTECMNAILASLDAGMPVTIGLVSNSGAAHQAVVDGYGYNGGQDIYCHLNFALADEYDGWYSLGGEAMAGGLAFSAITDIVYNIHPTTEGDVISGRILDSSGNGVEGVSVVLTPPSGATVSTTTDAKGIYAFRFKGKGKFRVTATDSTLGSAEQTVNIAKAGQSVDYEFKDSDFALSYGTAAVIANMWGVDMTLTKSSTPTPPPAPVSANVPTPSVFDGYVMNGSDVAGMFNAKVAKANNKTGKSKVTATVILAGVARKMTYKGEMDTDGSASLSCAGQPDMKLDFSADEVSGSMNGATIVGVRNLFVSKDREETAKAAEGIKPLLGSFNVVGDEGVFNVKIQNKGKAKVSGVLASGQKVSVSAQLLEKDGAFILPVSYTKKADSGAFVLTISTDGTSVTVSGLTDAVAGKAESLADGAKFSIDKTDELWTKFAGVVFTEYLPDGLSVSQTGNKWVVAGGAKPGKVMYQRGTTEVDKTKLGDNPSGLKLTYKAQTGAINGSFKVYAVVSGKVKATNVKLSGVLVGKVGYLTVTVKNPAGTLAATVGL